MFVSRLELEESLDSCDDPIVEVGACGTMSLYVCNGGGCKDKDAKKVRAKLKELLKERGLEDRVKVKKTDCMGECGQGPIIKMKPGKRVFKKVKPKKVAAILDELESVLDKE